MLAYQWPIYRLPAAYESPIDRLRMDYEVIWIAVRNNLTLVVVLDTIYGAVLVDFVYIILFLSLFRKL